MKMNRNCPVCGNRLVAGPADGLHVVYCEESITLPGGRQKNHYYEDFDNRLKDIYILPYRIRTTMFREENTSKVGTLSQYKTGRKAYYFKTLVTCPEIHPDTEDRLKTRIKTLLTFS